MRVGFIGLLWLLLTSLALPLTAAAQTPTASPQVDQYISKDDPEKCDVIGRAMDRDSIVERYDPKFAACSPSGLQAELRCWVSPDTALFQTVTIDCALYFRTSGPTFEMQMSDLLLITNSGREYPSQHREISNRDESPLTKDEPHGERSWVFAFDIPQDAAMPLAVEFPNLSDETTLVFVIETLSVPV